jgi:hypothetical protein
MPNPENIADKKFPKGQSGNPNGRPKKLYSDHINDLKAKGYSPPTKTEYFDMVGLLLAMEEEDLKEFAQDKKRPYWIRLIVIDMNSKQTRQKMMSDYRDWLFGRAHTSQNVDITTKGESITTEDLRAAWLESLKDDKTK